MANVNVTSKFKIAGQNAYYLGNPGGDSMVGTYAIMLQNDGSFSGTVTVKARIRMLQEWQSDTVTPVAWSYLTYYLNGSAGTGIVNTGITDTSLIFVPASGCEIVLDCASYTSGYLTVYTAPCQGAAA